MIKPFSIPARVFALGESLIDLIYNGQMQFNAVAGGSVLNAAVSMSRAGMEVLLVSEFGNDNSGKLLAEFLATNHISTKHCSIGESRKTSLAVAFLDENKNATYTFYHDFPAEYQSATLPDFCESDYLLLGSFYSVRPDRRQVVAKIIKSAAAAGTTILFDPNIRKNHFDGSASLIESFEKNMLASSIVKGSVDDFELLFGTRTGNAIYSKVSRFCKFLIITSGDLPVQVFTPSFFIELDVPQIKPKSTIGAGDNFNAGLLYGLTQCGIDAKVLPETDATTWKTILNFACLFAANACASIENYISYDFAQALPGSNYK